MYRIKNWNKIFENADSRKRQRLGYFCCPSGNDSQGYIELMSLGERGMMAYAVFMGICQWSATCVPQVRGTCARSDGRALTSRQIATTIRMPIETVDAALELLSSPDVGWIEVEKTEENQQSADHVPTNCRSSATNLPGACHKEKDKEKDKEKEKEKEKCGQRQAAGRHKRKNEYPDDFEEFWKVYPKKADKAKALKAWEKAKKIEDPELIIARAVVYSESQIVANGYAKNASGWLNDKRWQDDDAAWNQSTSNGKTEPEVVYRQLGGKLSAGEIMMIEGFGD